jgi:carbonic anhydrase/acetyltransferase-like protein (isoleucine patch superfamily)
MIRSWDGKLPKIADSAYVSEMACIIGSVEIGENSGVWPFAVIRGDFANIKIGHDTMIEDNCVIHGSKIVEIGNNVTVGHSVVLHEVKIGNNCLIGNNATVLDRVEIGNFCVIAAGSLVTPDTKIPDNSFVTGSPAIIKGKPSLKMQERLENGTRYSRLLKQYKEQGI